MPLKAACYASLETKVTYKVPSEAQPFCQVSLSFKAESRNSFTGSPQRLGAFPTQDLGTSCPSVNPPHSFDSTPLDSEVSRCFHYDPQCFADTSSLHKKAKNLVRAWQEKPFYLFVVVIQSARLADDQRPY